MYDNSSGTDRWPPAGAESIHGAAWTIIALLAAGVTLMTAPVLWALALPRAFGAAGGGWWVLLATSLAGLILVLAAIGRLVGLLLAGARCARAGLGWWSVVLVAADARRDTGLLLAGARHWRELGETERRWLVRARLTAVLTAALALLWVPPAFVAGIMLAARGIITASALLALVIVPATLLLAVALVARTVDTSTVQRLERAWQRDDPANARPAPAATLAMRGAAVALVLLALLLPVPVATVGMATAFGPALVRMATPSLGSMTARLARARLLEPYGVPADSAISATEAGGALQVLVFSVRDDAVRPLERAPVRRFAEPWPDALPASVTDLYTYDYAAMLARATSLTTDELEFHERVARHPAQAVFARLARAPAADIGGGRWDLDSIADASLWELPSMRAAALHTLAKLHIAKAVHEMAIGDHAAAGTTLREVISVGLLVGRDGPQMIDVLTGFSMAETGAAALVAFYDATGRTTEADALRSAWRGVDAYERSARLLRQRGERTMGDARAARDQVLDDDLPRGIRWERLAFSRLMAGCLSPHTAVFGGGSAHADWLDSARASLVRYPSEAALFDLSASGGIGSFDRRRGLLRRAAGRMLDITFGDTRRPDSCAAAMSAFAAVGG
jgi:hypothetical protein